MKKSVIFFVFFLLLLLGISVAVKFLIFDSPVKWTVKGDAFCNNRYPICLQNEPRWTPEFEPQHLFKRPKELLGFTKPMKNVNGEAGFAKIVILSVDSTIMQGVRIVSPLPYLQGSINTMRRRCFKFEEQQPPSVEVMNNQKVAKAQFFIRTSSHSRPVISTLYAFVSGKQGCSIVYFATPDQFEENREEATRIIKSFRFGREEIK